MMRREHLAYLADYVRKESGISLDEGKGYLLESRLLPLARDHGIEGLEGLAREIQRGNRKLADAVVEAMTTNETFFFRDAKVFQYVEDVLIPEIARSTDPSETIHIWCAACSFGQEPYSIAALVRENERILGQRRVSILGTDISREALERGRRARYSDFEVARGLPVHMRARYFTRCAEPGWWEVSPDLRNMVSFKHHNLLYPLPSTQKFHVILMRNVLIYFEPAVKQKLLTNIHGLLRKNGKLFLGGIETVAGLSSLYEPVRGVRGVFQAR